MENEKRTAELLVRAYRAEVLRRAVLSMPTDKNVKKATLTPVSIGGRELLQLEVFTTDNKALHRNIPADDTETLCGIISGYARVNLLTSVGDCEYRASRSGNSTVINGDKLEHAIELGAGTPARVEFRGNNREKNHILRGDEEFLKLLDVSDQNGRVHDKRQPKFRQINRFLELVRDAEEYLPADGRLEICDLCCGKSYLSFAVYHYFAVIKKRDVRMIGVDLKEDVVKYCNSVAEKLGWDGMKFYSGDIRKFTHEGDVNLVVSLHACDVATDIVLEKAVEWKADVILSTPCCHHELNHTLNCPTLDFIARHSMLRQKFCDAATDAMRLKLLEAKGYDVCALELIDPEETPKNIMLRGIRRKDFCAGSEQAKKLYSEYLDIRKFLLGDEKTFSEGDWNGNIQKSLGENDQE